MLSVLERMMDVMKEHGLTERKVASLIGVNSTAFSDWKRGKGKPSVDATLKFAEYFNISLEYLFYGQELEFVEAHLSEREQDLLKQFRKLSSENQLKLIGFVEGMIFAAQNGTV